MATEVVKIVDPDNGPGTDYTSLSQFVSNEARNLVSADEIAVAKCRCTGGTADTTPVTISGFTTDATRYIKVYTDPFEGYRHAGKYQTGNKYRLTSSSGTALTISNSYTILEGIQSIYTGTGSNEKCLAVSSGVYGVHIRKNFFKVTQGIASGAIAMPLFITTEDSSNYIYNNIIVLGSQYNHGNNSGILCDSHPNETVFYLYVYNNTFIGGAYSINSTEPNCVLRARNNILYNQVNDPNISNPVSCNYNSTDRGTATGGANDRVNQTFSFEDPGNDDYHLKYYDQGARGWGTSTLSSIFTDDIDGETRPGSGSWDIGADQFNNDIPVNRQYVRGATSTWYEVVDVYVLKDGIWVPDKVIKILDDGNWI